MIGSGLGKLYTFKTNVPLLGDVRADVPIEQMTIDATDTALIAMERKLPLFLDRNMPVMYASAKPYIDQELASLTAQVQYLAPQLVDDTLQDIVLPELEVQKERALAEFDKRMAQTLFGLAMITTAGVVAAYFLRRM